MCPEWERTPTACTFSLVPNASGIWSRVANLGEEARHYTSADKLLTLCLNINKNNKKTINIEKDSNTINSNDRTNDFTFSMSNLL